MPAQAGETTLVTVFSDVHYFFSPPDYKPLHHRFDKGSYVYVHHNSTTGRGRVEIANNAGTPEQDALAGALETAHITYSYNRPTTVSVTLSSVAAQATQQPWQLPGYDLRNERKYMYNLNSLDLYLWTPEDAIDFVEALTNVKSIGALDIHDAPDPEGQGGHLDRTNDTLSPVVQQLEQAAISAPYKRESTSTTQSVTTPQPATPSAVTTSSSSPGTQASADAATAFAPMPYNPAAPAAPESRIHREKTPPPPDAETGIGLAGGAGPHAAQQPQYPYNQQQQQQQPPQPQLSYTASSPPNVLQQQQQPHPSYGTSSPPQQQQQQQQQVPSFAPPPTQPQQPNYSGYQTQSPSFAAQPASTAQSPPQTYASTSPPLQQTPQAYSSYSYAGTQQQQQSPPQPAYNIHQQFYVPTQHEAGKIPSSQLPAHSKIPGQPGQLQPAGQTAPASSGGKVQRVERGVNKLLKKLEKY